MTATGANRLVSSLHQRTLLWCKERFSGARPEPPKPPASQACFPLVFVSHFSFPARLLTRMPACFWTRFPFIPCWPLLVSRCFLLTPPPPPPRTLKLYRYATWKDRAAGSLRRRSESTSRGARRLLAAQRLSRFLAVGRLRPLTRRRPSSGPTTPELSTPPLRPRPRQQGPTSELRPEAGRPHGRSPQHRWAARDASGTSATNAQNKSSQRPPAARRRESGKGAWRPVRTHGLALLVGRGPLGRPRTTRLAAASKRCVGAGGVRV